MTGPSAPRIARVVAVKHVCPGHLKCAERQPRTIVRPRLEIGPTRRTLSSLFDLNDGLALVCPAIQAGVMRQFQFMALRAHGHPWRRHTQFLRATFIASCPRMFMFRIGHGHSFVVSPPARSSVCRPLILLAHAAQRLKGASRGFGDASARALVQIFPALRAEPWTLLFTERMHRRG